MNDPIRYNRMGAREQDKTSLTKRVMNDYDGLTDRLPVIFYVNKYNQNLSYQMYNQDNKALLCLDLYL